MVESQWLPTPSLMGAEGERLMAGFHGLWAAPASPYQSMQGMLDGIEFAGVPSKPGFGLLGWSRGGATGRSSALEGASNMLCHPAKPKSGLSGTPG
jgi:hypothetical protein